MNKKASFLFICSLIVLLAVSKVESAGEIKVLELHTPWLWYEVRAPPEVKVGEEFSVTFLLYPRTTLNVTEIRVEIYGNIGPNGEYIHFMDASKWKYAWANMSIKYGVDYRVLATFTVNSVPDINGIGGVYGRILVDYYAFGERFEGEVSFDITRIYMKTFQDYNSLNQSYQNLQKDYNSLEANFRLLTGSVFIGLIVVGVIVVYVKKIKPKKSPWDLSK
jgi:hypothetical protein